MSTSTVISRKKNSEVTVHDTFRSESLRTKNAEFISFTEHVNHPRANHGSLTVHDVVRVNAKEIHISSSATPVLSIDLHSRDEDGETFVQSLSIWCDDIDALVAAIRDRKVIG